MEIPKELKPLVELDEMATSVYVGLKPGGWGIGGQEYDDAVHDWNHRRKMKQRSESYRQKCQLHAYGTKLHAIATNLNDQLQRIEKAIRESVPHDDLIKMIESQEDA